MDSNNKLVELRRAVVLAAPKITSDVKAKVAQIAHNPYITLKGYITTNKVDRYLSANKADAVVVFGNDYDKTGECQIAVDASNTTTAQTAAGYLAQILSGEVTGATPGITILYNPQLKSAYNFVPGIMGLIFILICAMLTSVSIVREKETRTMEVLLVSPIRPVMIVVAKMIPYFALACIDLVLILTVSRFALGVPLSGSMAALFVISFIYIILALALGMLVSTLVDSQMTALLISGMVFPVENMPVILQWISNIVPARWYIPAMRKIMIEGLDFSYVAKELIILATMATVLIGISVKRFKNRLQ